MSDNGPGPGYYAHLTYNAPLSDWRAGRLVAALAATNPRTVLDVGCGWGELLLELLTAVPEATGMGVDVDPQAIARGRANADSRGLNERATFIEGLAAGVTYDPSDVVICLGSSQAFGGSADALHALFSLVRPGGRLLFGDGIWQQPPTGAVIELLEGSSHITDLAGVVDQAIEVGFRPLVISTATRGEWEAFESGFLADWEEWLAGNSEHPDAADVRARSDAHRDRWLRGYRDVLGFCHLILGRPAD